MACKIKPPSSYGSMKSDIEEEEEEELMDEELAVLQENPTSQIETRLEVNRCESPETQYTGTTQQTKPAQALVIEASPDDVDPSLDSGEPDEDDEALVASSPPPPEVPEPEDFLHTEDILLRGKLHSEIDLPHIFKNVQKTLSELTGDQLHRVRMSFCRWEPKMSVNNAMEGDLLDFVDKALETLGRDHTLLHTIRSLEAATLKTKADELQTLCKRALSRQSLKSCYLRKHLLIHEGVVRAGCQTNLESIYVEQEISTSDWNNVNPQHELQTDPPSPLLVQNVDTSVTINNLFHLLKNDGKPVRTVLTTGLPGIGMTVSVAKFCLDWAQELANRDIQFVIKLSFRKWWKFKKQKKEISAMEMITSLYPDYKGTCYLEEEDCRFLLIMDSFDCYRAALDWENAPVINDNSTQALPDVLIVNIIRGTVLRGARLWILGRRAAVSQIPTRFIDAFTELLGFNDQMKENFLSRHTNTPGQEAKIIAHFKRLPTLVSLARHPFVCWMVFTLFERLYRHRDYGSNPPRLTPFYINLMMVQMNRRLQFYYEKHQQMLDWSNEDKDLLIKIAKMALQMLEKDKSVFCEEDVKVCELSLVEVTVLSGMCTEQPAATPGGSRRFCFLSNSFQAFLAALYVFTMFRNERKNPLNTGTHTLIFQAQTTSVSVLVKCTLDRISKSRPGHYDMFLLFLCGLLNTSCYTSQLSGFLFPHKVHKLEGVTEVKQLLEAAMQSASQDRVENLSECIREMIQIDQ